jgi:hypothetical protein
MKNSICYKSCLIRGESFQLAQKIDAVNGAYVMDADEKQRLKKRQLAIHMGGG